MAAKHRDEFIKGMVASHRPAPPLIRPGRRALLWFAIALPLIAVAMTLRQEFRSGFGSQLVQHPTLLLEVVSALVLTLLGSYAALVRSIPGEAIPRWTVTALWVTGVLFAAAVAAEFTHFAPEASMLGKRLHCWVEVVVFGGAGTVAFVALVRRGWVRFSWKIGATYGLVALIPGALMQLACMYDPVHNVLFHFLPALPVIALGLVLMKRAADRGPRD